MSAAQALGRRVGRKAACRALNLPLIVAEVGAVVILGGTAATIAQLVVNIRTRESRRDRTGDPWSGRTLEWSTTSPPPAYNFAVYRRSSRWMPSGGAWRR